MLEQEGQPGRNCVGHNVRTLRKKRGITQEVFAGHCQLLGWDLTRSTLSKIEACLRCVTDYEIVLLARALRVSEAELFSGVQKEVLMVFREGASSYSQRGKKAPKDSP
jgi:transcriptional regulator with XRE-family HTH domain